MGVDTPGQHGHAALLSPVASVDIVKSAFETRKLWVFLPKCSLGAGFGCTDYIFRTSRPMRAGHLL